MSRRPTVPLAAALAVALLAGACSKEQAADGGTASQAEVESRAAVAAADAAAPAAPSAAAEPAVSGPGVGADAMGSAAMTQPSGTRRFVRTAQVDCQVADVQRSTVRIEDLAARFGGFVTRSEVTADVRRTERRPIGNARLVELSTYVTRGELQVRVPSDRAQAFLRAIASEMEFLDRRRYEAVDVQFELLRRELARLRHDRAQSALGDVAQDGRPAVRADVIDRRAAQQAARDEAIVEQRGFEYRVEFATLDITMRQPERVRRAERPDVDAVLRHEGPGFVSRVGGALADGWRGVLELVLIAITIWPLWLAAAIVVIVVRRLRRR